MNILGVGISVVKMEDAVLYSERVIQSGRRGYVCATDVHTIIEAQSDPRLRHVLNRAILTTPDGMPLVWIGRLLGYANIDRVYGPDYMLEMCRVSAARGYRNFLFGGKSGVVDDLKVALERRFPGLSVVGTYTPPFRPLNPHEEDELIEMVDRVRPDIFWVGLGSPKQDLFMAQYAEKLNTKLMVGVGAAFDFHVGAVKEAPEWIKRSGLQWAHRLFHEPERLWRRYFTCIPAFIWKIGLQLSGLRKYSTGVEFR